MVYDGGEVLWAAKLDGAPSGAPVAAGACVVVPTGDGAQAALQALDRRDGVLRWQRSFEHVFVSGLAAAPGGGCLVALTSGDLLRGAGALVALDGAGKEVWRWAPAGVQRVSAPAMVEDAAVVTAGTTTLVVLDTGTGEVRVEVSLDVTASLAAPAVAAGVAYVPCKGPHVAAVDLTGGVRWRLDFDPGAAVWLDQTPLVLGDVLIAVSNRGHVLAARRQDGAILWQTTVGPAGKPLTAPVSDGDRLYVGARDGVYALAPEDGGELWYAATARQIDPRASLVVRDGVVYAACHDHHVYALDAGTGRVRWSSPEAARRFEVAPVLAICGEPPQACLLTADRSGAVHALALPLSVDELEAAGRWRDAAALCEDGGDVERAATLYERACAWRDAARLWAAVDRPLRQAEALVQHAQSLVGTDVAAEAQAAVWRDAAEVFAVEGAEDRVAVCRREIARCLRLPIMTLDAEWARGFVLEAWSQLCFVIRNDGFGPARNLAIRAEGDRFQGTVMRTQEIVMLRAGQRRAAWVDVRPLEFGETVPLRVVIEYVDRTGDLGACEQTIYLPVAREEALRGAGQTITIIGDGNVIGDDSSSVVSQAAAAANPTSSDAPTGAPVKPLASADPPSTAALRRRLDRLDDVELDTLCLDHFPAVYDKFGRGQRRDERVNLLLDYVRRRPEEAARLADLLPG